MIKFILAPENGVKKREFHVVNRSTEIKYQYLKEKREHRFVFTQWLAIVSMLQVLPLLPVNISKRC